MGGDRIPFIDVVKGENSYQFSPSMSDSLLFDGVSGWESLSAFRSQLQCATDIATTVLSVEGIID